MADRIACAGIVAIAILCASAESDYPGVSRESDYPRAPRETVVVSPETIAILKQFLRSDEPTERSESLGMLRIARDRSVVGDVRPLVDDPDASVRAQAILTLEALMTGPDLVAILLAKCRDGSPQVTRQALGILGSVSGGEAFDGMLALQSSIGPEFVEAWAAALARRSETVPPEVVQRLLNAENSSTRAAAVQIVERQPQSLDLSQRIALLNDPFHQVRAHAIMALRDAGDDPSVQKVVIEHLQDPSSLVRRAAVEWLGRVSPSMQAIEPRLDDRDPTVRIAAIHVIAQLRGEKASAGLVNRFSDREVLVAEAASDDLASIGGDELAKTLAGIFGDTREQVVRMAVRTLGLMKHAGSVDALQGLAEHPTPLVRSTVYEALGRIGDPRIVPWLLDRAKNESEYPRAAINESLGRLKDVRAVPHLLADCHFPDERSKGINSALFGPMGGPAPYSDPANAVATAAVRSLGEIGDTSAVPGLVELSLDILRDEAFWTAIITSLDQLGDARAKPAFVQLGITGEITQGMFTMPMPPNTRIAALRAIARLRMTELVNDILGIAPARCVLEVRQAAAAVLTQLTGETYAYRLPPRQHDSFVEDRGTTLDLTEFKQPICHRLEKSESK